MSSVKPTIIVIVCLVTVLALVAASPRARRQKPHSIHRIDFNRDQYPDFLLLEGEEEYFRSSILLATRIARSPSDSGLRLIYEQTVSPYVAVIDPDGDSHPEILASSEFIALRDCDERLGVPDTVLGTAVREYHRLVGAYDSVNFTYGGMKQYPFFNLALDRVVHILRVERSQLRDVSGAFVEHGRWRRATLRSWAESVFGDTAASRSWMSDQDRLVDNEAIAQCARGLELLAQQPWPPN